MKEEKGYVGAFKGGSFEVYFTGKLDDGYDKYEEQSYIDVEVIVVNNSEEPASLTIESASINGWDVDHDNMSSNSGIQADIGKRSKGFLRLFLERSDIETSEDVEEFAF